MSAAVIAPGVTLESNRQTDRFEGTVSALLAAGVIEQKHLIPQPGRLSGITMFLPDGQPVPPGWIAPTGVPGHLSVRVLRSGTCVVRKTVSSDEHQRRIDALPPYVHEMDGWRIYRGTMEKLLAVGVPAKWLEGLPAPGKSRGRRAFDDGDERVEVSVGPRREFYISTRRRTEAEQERREEAQAVRRTERPGLSGESPSAARQQDPAVLDEGDIAAIGELLTRRRRMQAPSSMGMPYRRKLPPGWRVIEGQRPA